ncbi:MAG: radical SAM protein [candidate division Zixibacteria bacterium]|nr:radical SAM protein [candidate division Zixibacteria bacterium]
MRHLWHSIKIATGMMGTPKAFTGPFWVQIGIANPCNHRCIMCWDHPTYVPENRPYPTVESKRFYEEHPEINRDKGFMDLGMLEALMEDLHDLGTRRVELAGRGEPTLHPRFDRVVEILKGRGFNVGIVTNGSLLHRKRCEHIVSHGLDRIVVSLNAGTRDTYPRIHTTETPEDYDRVLHNLQVLREIKTIQGKKLPRVMLSFVISRHNCDEGLTMIDRGKDVGADQIVFKYVVPYPNIEFLELREEEKRSFSRQLPTLSDRARSYGIDLKVEPPIGDLAADPRLSHRKTEIVYSKIPCYIGWYFALITAEGSVSPCCQCMEQMGHLRHQRFRGIWYSVRYSDFREKMKRFPERFDDPTNYACDECDFEKVNTTVYNTLHFHRPVRLHDGQREFSFVQLLPRIFSGRSTHGAKAVRRGSVHPTDSHSGNNSAFKSTC